MKSVEKWLNFEDEIQDSLISKLKYDNVNVWYFMRNEMVSFLYRPRRILKLRLSIWFMRLIFFAYRLSIMVLCRCLIGNYKEMNGKKRVLITTRARDWGQVRDMNTGEMKNGEVLYDTIISELRERNYDVIMAYEFPMWFYQSVLGIKKLFPRIQNGTLVSAYFWSPSIWAKAYVTSHHYRDLWNNWGYKTKLNGQMLKVMEFYLCFYSQIVIEDIEIAKRVFHLVNPDVVVSWAWGGFRLAINMVGKNHNVPIVSCDYGFVTELDCLITDKSEDLPDVRCVAFESVYKLLRSKGLTDKQVVFTGASCHDVVRSAKKIYSREAFCNRFGLNSNKQIILILSGASARAKDLIKSSIQALRKQDVEIVIKLHPRDNIEKFKEFASNKVKILPKNTDLFEALYVSDLNLGYYSTTLLEGLRFGTPAISVNFSGERYSGLKVLKQNTLQVPVTELGGVLNKVLHDKETQELLNRRMENYRRESRCDGYATRRICDIIERYA